MHLYLENYSLFLIPLIVAITCQAIKLATNSIKGDFNLKHFFDYGGMPSSHAAIVTSLALIIYIEDGSGSSAFALALILAILIIRDAVGIRRRIGNQAKVINQLVAKLPSDEQKKYNHLLETVGHTVPEIAVGILYGITVTLFLAFFI